MSDVVLSVTQKKVELVRGDSTISITPPSADIIITSKGSQGIQGVPGLGVPPGGEAGQYLRKVDDTDNNTEWLHSWVDITTEAKHTGVTTAIPAGTVYHYTYKATTIYRLVTSSVDAVGYPSEDSFYSDFDGTNLTNLIIARG